MVIPLEIFAAAGMLLLVDQWSKRVVRVHVRDRSILCGPILRIRCVTNMRQIYAGPGTRFGLVLVWVVALISATILHEYGRWFQTPLARLALGAAFGGAAGNLLDIIRRRPIVDFIDLRYWPVFNLADAAIVAGLVAACWL
jgi:signal peptidase II